MASVEKALDGYINYLKKKYPRKTSFNEDRVHANRIFNDLLLRNYTFSNYLEELETKGKISNGKEMASSTLKIYQDTFKNISNYIYDQWKKGL